MGAATAAVLAIFAALSVAGATPPGWELALRLSPSGVELTATSERVVVALTF
jgi:hypothetical protein